MLVRSRKTLVPDGFPFGEFVYRAAARPEVSIHPQEKVTRPVMEVKEVFDFEAMTIDSEEAPGGTQVKLTLLPNGCTMAKEPMVIVGPWVFVGPPAHIRQMFNAAVKAILTGKRTLFI